jgi:hypothetical protein
MEALYLDCGARRPQLKRNPLGRCRALTRTAFDHLAIRALRP